MPPKMIHPLLVGVSACRHDIPILVGAWIQLADKSSVESFTRISAGASRKSLQADSRDQEEQSQAGIRVDGYWIFHVSQYQQNAWRFCSLFFCERHATNTVGHGNSTVS